MASFGAGYLLGVLNGGAKAEADARQAELARGLGQALGGVAPAPDVVVPLGDYLAAIAERDRYRAAYGELRRLYEQSREDYATLAAQMNATLAAQLRDSRVF